MRSKIITSFYHDKLFNRVINLALPAAFKQLLDILQILVDMLMLGSISIAALAAVGMSMQFMMIINVIMTIYIVGGNAIVSRYIGSQQHYRAASLLFSLILFTVLIAIVVSIVGYSGAYSFYNWMGTSTEVTQLGGSYFSILSMGMILIFLDTLFFNIFSAAGDTKKSLYIKIISIMINIFFNYIFIFGEGIGGYFIVDAMGIEGAAYATLIAYGVNLLAYSYLFISGKSPISVIAIFKLKDIIRVIKVGIPAALERMMSVIGFVIFVMIITHYGTESLAGYQVGLRIEGLAFMPGFGFSVAAMALVGQSLGAKKYHDAYKSGVYSAALAVGFMGSIGFVLFFFPEYLISFFTKDERTTIEATLYLKLVALAQIPLALAFVMSGVLRGAGATKITLKVNVFSLWLFRVLPALLVLYLELGIIWIYVIMNIETWIKGLIFLYIFRKKEWQKTQV